MNNKYLLLYGDKKPEDSICIPFMFENYKEIPLGWTEKDKNVIIQTIEDYIKDGIEQVIFWGLEVGWDYVIEVINKKYSDNIKIKVICNTQDSLLYYDYERNNFFKLLKLSKERKVKNIAFFRKGMYETYKNLGYNCSYILENIILDKRKIEIKNKSNKKINIGIYPLNYTWDKNIFNQLSIGKFINNSIINYNKLDERMIDFLKTMSICNNPEKITNYDAYNIANIIDKNDVLVLCDFTDYIHPISMIGMELGIPCILGNNSDLYNETLNAFLVVNSEDNPIKISDKVNNALENIDKIKKEYLIWKNQYNINSKQSIEEFITK